MTRHDLENMTTGELVDRFVEIAVAQDRALLYSEIKEYNRLFDRMTLVQDEMKSRTGDQRRALLRLYDHANWQVRLAAARATLAVEPSAARTMLEAIAGSRHFPQAGDAGMTLSNLDRGIYKPK